MYGLGAVLSHEGPGGERPIAFASHTLADSEQKYSQIEKEALALVWGIRRFQQYLLGNHFTLITDHQPLTSILHPEKGLPAVTAARLHRYAVLLSGYSYDIRYRSTTLHANADALSRLPLIVECPEPEEMDDGAEYMIRQLEQLPVTVASLQEATSWDPVLAKVLHAVCTNRMATSSSGRNFETLHGQTTGAFYSARVPYVGNTCGGPNNIAAQGPGGTTWRPHWSGQNESSST